MREIAALDQKSGVCRATREEAAQIWKDEKYKLHFLGP